MRKRTCFYLPLTTGRDRCSFAVAQMGHTSTGSAQGYYVPVVVRSGFFVTMSQPSYFRDLWKFTLVQNTRQAVVSRKKVGVEGGYRN